MVRTERIDFGSPDFPIDSVLGPRTRKVLATAHSAESFIIKKRSSGSLSSAQILAVGNALTAGQIQLIKDAANDPRAYYNGHPIFRRLPPGQDFAIQLHADCDSLDLMIGLHNPSWGFYCAAESYRDWNWVGHIFKEIAKGVFPEYASSSAKSVWKKGTIAELERALKEKQ